MDTPAILYIIRHAIVMFLQENRKWQEKDGKLIAMTDSVDYDIEGL